MVAPTATGQVEQPSPGDMFNVSAVRPNALYTPPSVFPRPREHQRRIAQYSSSLGVRLLYRPESICRSRAAGGIPGELELHSALRDASRKLARG